MESLWATTSSVMAMIHNVNCTKKSDMKSPVEFNPMIQRERNQKADLHSLRTIGKAMIAQFQHKS